MSAPGRGVIGDTAWGVVGRKKALLVVGKSRGVAMMMVEGVGEKA